LPYDPGGAWDLHRQVHALHVHAEVSGLQSRRAVRLAGVDVGTVDEVVFIASADRD
jgi:ABC-type transporter Mla subunit MlaD